MKKLPKSYIYPRPYGSDIGRVKLVDSDDIRNKNVLDIGCGYGWFETYCLRNGVKKIVGADISAEAIKIARKLVRNRGASFLVTDATLLPFQKNVFHTIFAWELLEHIFHNKEAAFFKEVSRVLKPGGTFYLSTPYDSFFAKFFDPAWLPLGHRHYGETKLRSLGEDVGFTVERIFSAGRWLSILYTLNMYISKWIFRRRPIFHPWLKPLYTKEYERENGFITIFAKYRKNV